MERKEVFFEMLNEEFSKYGFKFVKSKKAFVKRENGNKYAIEYETWPYFFAIKTHYYSVVKEIEEIKKKAWGDLYRKPYFGTFGTVRQEIKKTDTLEKTLKVANEEIEFFHKFLLRYFENSTNYAYLDKLLNTEPGSKLDFAYSPVQTFFVSIIVGKLANNPKIEDLYILYRRLTYKYIASDKRYSTQKLTDETMKKYDLLVNYLKNMK